MTTPPAPELAHYHTAWTWPDRSLEWMKGMLLFFDGLAWALPQRHCNRVLDQDPVLAQPLMDAGLLHNFDPGDWMTPDLAGEIRQAARNVVRDRNLFLATRDRPMTLTAGHLAAPSEVSEQVVDEMLAAGVVTRRQLRLDSDLVEMHSSVHEVVLTVVALALRATLDTYDIHPVADYNGAAPTALIAALAGLGASVAGSSVAQPANHWAAIPSRPPHWARGTHEIPSVGFALSHDIENVGIDLTGVPVDEVLDFRNQHGRSYRVYARALRDFATDLAAAPPVRRDRMLHDRTEEIAEYASELRAARRAFARPGAAFALAVAGATWTTYSGNVVGAVISALSAAVSLRGPGAPSSAYTYLFETRAKAHRP